MADTGADGDRCASCGVQCLVAAHHVRRAFQAKAFPGQDLILMGAAGRPRHKFQNAALATRLRSRTVKALLARRQL
jgi:hypothetical protein